MQIARLVVAACALLVVSGCGAGYSPQAASGRLPPPSPTAAAAEQVEPPAPESNRTSLGNGVVLTMSQPTSFTPTDTAYPHAPRAVAFNMVIDNGSELAFRPAQLSFTASVDGAPTEQVIDSTQGYTGVSGTADEVAPDQSVRFAVAFSAPARQCTMRVAVRAGAESDAVIGLFDGVV